MTMSEFNNLMQEMNLKYSIMVCFDLGTAADFGKRVMYWQRQLKELQPKVEGEHGESFEKVKARYEKSLERAKNQLEKAQHNALASAMFEKDNGLIFEPLIENYSLTQLTTVNEAVKQWQPVLKKYGVELKMFGGTEDDKTESDGYSAA